MSAPHRLSRVDFNHFTVERRLGGAYMTLALGSVRGRRCYGFACVVSKKAARRAVDRNRIKRRVRAIFQEYASLIPNPLVLVVYAKPRVSKVGMDDIRKDIQTLLNRLNLLPPGGGN